MEASLKANKKSDMRKSEKSSEVLSFLVKSSLGLERVLIWQNIGEERYGWSMRILKVDLNTRSLEFSIDPENHINNQVKSQGSLNDIMTDRPLFVKGLDREFLFKIEEGLFFIHENVLVTPVPGSSFFPEFRGEKRFEPQGFSTLSLLKNVRQRGQVNFDLQLKNISPSGVGLHLSFANAHLLSKKDKVTITRLLGFDLPAHIEATIPYVRRYHYEKEKKILVGLKFSKRISDTWWQQIVN